MRKGKRFDYKDRRRSQILIFVEGMIIFLGDVTEPTGKQLY